jgi:cystathionine beta-synthase
MRGIISLIGKTPMVEVTSFDTGRCRLFLKMESQNPGGSIKDRVALSMIQVAEDAGLITSGSRIIEATAGNTGIGLALISVAKGFRLTLVIPDKMSREKIRHLRAMGAEIILTRSDVPRGHPQYYQDLAESIQKSDPGSFYVNQFSNPANPLAHETTTAPEIYRDMKGHVDAVVCGVGSGGTITGLSQYFSKQAPNVEMVLADPVGSILAHYVETGEVLSDAGSWVVEGIGEDFIPSIADLSRVKKAYAISDQESCDTARALLIKEGILAGSSSGTLVAAALRYCREQTTAKNVVTFICDSGNKYLSKVYDDYWMRDEGFLPVEHFGDLRDIIGRAYSEGSVVFLREDETLQSAYSRMKIYDVSQLPVLENERIVGIIDELDVLLHLKADREAMKRPVREIMTKDLETLDPRATVDSVLDLLEKGLVPIVQDGSRFLGIITRMDVLNYLRRVKDNRV